MQGEETNNRKVLDEKGKERIVEDKKEINSRSQVLGKVNDQNQALKNKEDGKVSEQLNNTPPEAKNPTQNSKKQQQIFSLTFTHHTITFSLTQQTLTITAEQQLNRTHFTQSFTHEKFTEPMKALFESVNDLWSVLESSKQNILFDEDNKLWFKIKLSDKKDKSINIPLIEKQYTDPQYITKLEDLTRKYIQLTKRYQQKQQLEQRKDNKTIGISKLAIKSIENKGKHFTMPTDFNLDSQRSIQSNTWPQQPDDGQQIDDPLVKFDQLLQRLSYMRDNFTLLAQQVQQRIKSKSDPKLIKVKLLYLQQRKKSFEQQLYSEKVNFEQFQCKDDIYNEINELVKFVNNKYVMLEAMVTTGKKTVGK